MKLKRIILGAMTLCGLLIALPSCDDWTEAEGVDINITRPDKQDPAAWEQYTALVRAYKQTSHRLVYAMLHNAPETSTSERDFLRSLPDSVDIVSLDRMPSAADLEDLPLMHKLGVRVLCPLCLEEDAGQVAATVREHGFDGVVLRPSKPFSDLNATLQSLGEVGLVVYEGPLELLDAQVIVAVDLVVLPTAAFLYQSDIDRILDQAVYVGLTPDKTLLSVTPGTSIRDYRNRKCDALELGAYLTTSKAFVGIALYDIGRDYYHPGMNYKTVRRLISQLNLMPKTDK